MHERGSDRQEGTNRLENSGRGFSDAVMAHFAALHHFSIDHKQMRLLAI
jgi:hypothetical protein